MAFTFAMNVNPDSNLARSLGSSSVQWKINGKIVELIEITISATSETSVSVSNANITTEHVVLNPYTTGGYEISYTTSAGSVTFTCANGFTAQTFYLGVKV